MKAVWSFWSKPYFNNHSFWKSPLHHALSWVLSVETARKHLASLALYTDDEGARLLVDELGFDFDEVSTSLNALANEDPDWWALGKLLTYSLQQEPFVHIDYDVYLWSPLPRRLIEADVIGQNPESFDASQALYPSDQLKRAIRLTGGWLPLELAQFAPRTGVPQAVCCGIMGGRRVDFLRHFATQALRLAQDPANRQAWPLISGRRGLNLCFEQQVLMACLAFHRTQPDSTYGKMRVEYLFNDFTDARLRAENAGFTHLIGETKQDPVILKRLENRVRNDYPARYECCANRCGRVNRGKWLAAPLAQTSS